MKSKFQLSMPALCALTWFGHSCGASMATGRLAVQYCSRHGPWGLLSAVTIWVVTVGFAWIIMEYGRLIRARSYHDVVNTIYWPNRYVGGTMNIVWDITVLVSTIVTCGTCVAGTGALLETVFGINYTLGMMLFVALMLVLFLIGPGVLRRLGNLSLPMFILLLILCAIIIGAGWDNLRVVMSGALNSHIPEGAGGMSTIFNDGFTYGMTQAGFVATGVVYSGQFKSRRETNRACLLGFFFGCVGMLFCTVATLAWFPALTSETLPFVFVMRKFSGGMGQFLRVIYYVILIIAYVSTAGSIMSGAIARYKLILNKKIKSELVCTTILLLFFLLTATILGRLGLTALVNKGFKLVGNVRRIVWFYPLIVLGPIAIHRVNKKLKAEGAPEGALPAEE